CELRADGAVGPDLHDELVVVGPLADAGLLDLVLDADHRREAGIDRDDADLALLAGILVGGAVAAAVLGRHFHGEEHVVGERGDDVLGVDDLDRFVGGDVGGRHHAAVVAVDADGLGLVAGVLDHQALDVEDDVGDVLDDAGDGGDLVLHALDLDARDGAALQAGQEDPAQAVADGDAEAALERLDGKLAVGVRQGVAVAGYAVGQFQATPLDTHGYYLRGENTTACGFARRAKPQAVGLSFLARADF